MWGWKQYVPVATRRAKAQKKINQLRKKGKTIEPIEIEGRNIAKKFWGKQWCEHLETFSDYDNRLPRGRTYVRNGSVCHLKITKGSVEAFVIGSSLYRVNVNISALKESKWQAIKEKCSGQIGSLLELLKGKLSEHVMEVVANPREGLFPNHGEMDYSCDCPDWADMCKHVAAVLYGIGTRLDLQPDLLFQLRGVDASELIATKLMTAEAKIEDRLDDEGLTEIFGIDLDDDAQHKEKIQKVDPEMMTGTELKRIRLEMQLTIGKFAETLKVTPATIHRWEKEECTLNLQARSANAIAQFLEKTHN
ncbi:MAG: hypothetical protein K1000chlam3_00611 [Chlamydiae bacterium]|nr:hypothetical protein [Chlamydiota bacterium]